MPALWESGFRATFADDIERRERGYPLNLLKHVLREWRREKAPRVGVAELLAALAA